MKKNFDYLTSLRGLAALWVMFYHLREYIGFEAFLQYGYLAVDFFFILSGFVLALTYQEKISQAGKSLRAVTVDFYVKRIARIFPLHVFILFTMLCAYFIIDQLKGGDIFVGRFSFEAFFQQLFLVHNWGHSERLSWNVPAWSISTEIFAYIIFPLLVLLTSKSSLLIRFFLSLILLCVLAVIFAANDAQNIGDKIPQLGIYRCLIEFSLGMYVFALFQQNVMRINAFFAFLLALFISVICAYFLQLPNYFYAPVALLLVFYGFINIDEKYVKSLFHPVLIWLGDISYSIYLVHYFAKDLLKFSVPELSAIGVTELTIYFVSVIFISHLTYKFVEMPAKKATLNCFFKFKQKSVLSSSELGK